MKKNPSIWLGLRVIGAVVFGLIGWSLADLFPYAILPSPLNNPLAARLIFSIVLGVAGIFLVPLVSVRPMLNVIERIRHVSAIQIIANFIGLAAGLLLAALLGVPLADLPSPFGSVLPFVGAVVLGGLGLAIMSLRYREIFRLLNIKLREGKADDAHASGESLLLDTSVIIDGRVADIAAAGFLRGEITVPRFVLHELQHVADSSDAQRRIRGRRGLEVLKRLQQEQGDRIKIVDDDAPETQQVDEKLIVLAKRWRVPIVTNDYNLNKVASLQGVSVLNINELANAVKTMLLPGESLTIQIIQEGKEQGQGVGYLEDGTMVVVEEGRSMINRTVAVTVTKVLQTAAGRMIFAKP